MHEFYKGIDLIFYNLLKDLVDFTVNPEENHVEAGFDSSDLFVPPDGRETFLSFRVGKWELTKSSDGVFTLCTKSDWTRNEISGLDGRTILLDDVAFEDLAGTEREFEPLYLNMRQNMPPAFQTLGDETLLDRASRIMQERRNRRIEQEARQIERINIDMTMETELGSLRVSPELDDSTQVSVLTSMTPRQIRGEYGGW